MRAAVLIDRFHAAKVAVIGDVMLDHHVVGRASRLSEEAPVPVLQVVSERSALGGAANVAANIAALGGQVVLIGLLGDDPPAGQLVRAIEAAGRIEPRLFTDRDRPTVTKTRYLGGQHQIVRVDRERIAPAPPAIEDELIAEAQEAAAECAVLVLSDYGKGALTDRVLAAAFAAAAAHNRPVIVDPKRTSYADYRGATLITPNRKELTAATGLPCGTEAEAERAAGAAIAASGAAILLTRSEQGMSLYRADAPPAHLPAEAREVFDVSGAGDTVVAGMALALAAGLPPAAAMSVANAAAGVVVGKVGTATVTPAELSDALRAQTARAETAPEPEGGPNGGPVTSLAAAQARRTRWATEGLTVGFANGCFDLIHPGHVSLLSQAAAACDRLIVALNDDDSVRRLKGPTRPLQPLPARAAVMAALKGVDLVVAFGEDTPLALIEALRPDVLVKGADYREEDVVGAAEVKSWGGRVMLADLTAGQSTTALAAKAAEAGEG